MAAISIRAFGGIAPKISPRYLKPNQAQTAFNCDTFTGPIRPLAGYGTTVVSVPYTAPIQTLYRYSENSIDETQFWWAFTTDVDVVDSQIASDTAGWSFFTEGGVPYMTHSTLAIQGTTGYPAAERLLGLSAPTLAPILAVQGTADTANVAETRVYAFSFVLKEAGFEMESALSPPSSSVDVDVQNQFVTVAHQGTVPAGELVTHVRYYRATEGEYLYVGETAYATATLNDQVDPEDLGEAAQSIEWDAPPRADFYGLTNMANGIVAGFTGKEVLFSEPYRPYAWPSSYRIMVDYDVVGIASLDTTLVVLTQGTPFIMQGSHPDSIVSVEADLEQACVSKRSIVSVAGQAVYASPDGLISISPNGSRNLTQDIYDRAQWQALKPSSIHAYQHDNKYIAFYDTGSVQGGFIYDFASSQFVTHELYATAAFNDLQQDKLFLTSASGNIKAWGEGANLAYTWRSKKHSLPQSVSFSCAQVEAESYPVDVKIIAAGSEIYIKNVQNRNPFRIPAKHERDWEIEVTGTPEVFAVALAQSMEELTNA